MRDHIMDTGRPPSDAPAAAAWADPTRHVALNDTCYWWQCADIKTDAPPAWQLAPDEVNYLNFETRLVHENAEKGNQNRVYVQVHNRGPLPATNVTVKLMTAGASAGLPDLPADFWSAWPNSAGGDGWTPVGAPQMIPTLEALRPAVLQWDWTPPADADAHSCMLVVMDSASDAIPAATKAVFNIAQLVTTEKRAGLKNVHVVNLLADTLHPIPFHLHGSAALRGAYLLRLPPLPHPELSLALLLPKAWSKRLTAAKMPKGLKAAKLPATQLNRIKDHWLKREVRSEASWAAFLKTYDTTRSFSLDARSKGVELPLSVKAGAKESIMLLMQTAKKFKAARGPLATLTLTQTTADAGRRLVGGSTFVFQAVKPR